MFSHVGESIWLLELNGLIWPGWMTTYMHIMYIHKKYCVIWNLYMKLATRYCPYLIINAIWHSWPHFLIKHNNNNQFLSIFLSRGGLQEEVEDASGPAPPRTLQRERATWEWCGSPELSPVEIRGHLVLPEPLHWCQGRWNQRLGSGPANSSAGHGGLQHDHGDAQRRWRQLWWDRLSHPDSFSEITV